MERGFLGRWRVLWGGLGTQGKGHFGQEEGIPHFHQGGERKGGREQVKRGGCSVVTRDKPALVPKRGTLPELGRGQIPRKKGQPAA